jgi:hypothetical protein
LPDRFLGLELVLTFDNFRRGLLLQVLGLNHDLRYGRHLSIVGDHLDVLSELGLRILLLRFFLVTHVQQNVQAGTDLDHLLLSAVSTDWLRFKLGRLLVLLFRIGKHIEALADVLLRLLELILDK